MVRRAAPLLLALALVAAGCRTSSPGWGRGRYRVLQDLDDLEMRAGSTEVEPGGTHALLSWAGARATVGSPAILEFQLILFDDRDGDGAIDPGEALASRTSLERTTKVLVSAVRVPLGARASDLKGQLLVRTEARREGAQWRLLAD